MVLNSVFDKIKKIGMIKCRSIQKITEVDERPHSFVWYTIIMDGGGGTCCI